MMNLLGRACNKAERDARIGMRRAAHAARHRHERGGRTLADGHFLSIPERIRAIAASAPDRIALRDERGALTYRAFAEAMAHTAGRLAAAGVGRDQVVAICAFNSAAYVVAYFAAVGMGAVVAPLPQSATADSLARMIRDCDARLVLVDDQTRDLLAGADLPVALHTLDDITASNSDAADTAAFDWPTLAASDRFNIIYSSGTTGTPKGIVQSHAMRDAHVRLGEACNYRAGGVTLLSTPLYSNTTLVSLVPTLALGGTAVLMRKFSVEGFLSLAQAQRATHAMLVPIQYQRLMASEQFANYDLSAFEEKFCTSAPFAASLKQDVLARWPGGLTEYYGMTEGGGLCILAAHRHTDKLHTVGCPAPDTDMQVIDEDGRELPPGSVGEIVGHSANSMSGYHNRPQATADATWTSPDGKRYVRTGDIGRFDDDGFLVLMDRKKDVIISGGFNIYPSDLEDVLRAHPSVVDAAVVGVPSAQWGETPVGFVVAADVAAAELLDFVNTRVGKSQRLADLQLVDALPRSAIGKLLKRELRDRWAAHQP